MGNPLANLDPQALYAQMDPDQRAQIAQQFIQGYQQSGDPNAQHFAQMDPNQVSPDQLAAMHQHAVSNPQHHGLFGEVLSHPILTAALGGFGIYEADKYFGRRQ